MNPYELEASPWATECVPVQPELNKETMFQQNKTEERLLQTEKLFSLSSQAEPQAYLGRKHMTSRRKLPKNTGSDAEAGCNLAQSPSL